MGAGVGSGGGGAAAAALTDGFWLVGRLKVAQYWSYFARCAGDTTGSTSTGSFSVPYAVCKNKNFAHVLIQNN